MKSKHYLLLIVGLILSTLLIGCGNDTGPDTSESAPTAEAPTALPTNTVENTPIAEAPTALPTNTVENTPIAEAPTAQPTNTPESTTNTPTPVSDCQLNNSIFVADVTIPDNTVIAGGEAFVKTWRLQNSGSCTWTTNYEFVSIDNDPKGGQSVPVSQEVAPGGIIDLSVNFTAPGVPGTHRSTWQLRTPDGTLFGSKPYLQIVVPAEAPTPTPTSVPVAAGESEEQCNNKSVFLSDVTIPDNTVIAGGEAFVKTWRLQNSGSCTWTTNYEFVSIDNDPKGGQSVPVSQEVAPGGIVDLSVNFTAPGVPGTHRSTWQLRTPDGTLFGSKPYLQIVVPAEAPTPTPVPGGGS